MNKLEQFAISQEPIFSLSKSEVEEMFDVNLNYVKDLGKIPIILHSGEARHYLPKQILEGRLNDKHLFKIDFSMDIREADAILNLKRKELKADAVVSVTYAGPYCRNISDKTILARGYPVKIVK